MKAFSIPPHPPALSITKTCIYKTIGKVTIPIDIYVPTEGDVATPPIMLFIHGKLISILKFTLLFQSSGLRSFTGACMRIYPWSSGPELQFAILELQILTQ
jgi:hypothetical protein